MDLGLADRVFLVTGGTKGLGYAGAAALVWGANAQLTASERSSVEDRIKEATALCNADKYTDGYTVSAKLARFVGHLEAQKGIAPSL